MSDPAVEAAKRVRSGHPYCRNDHHTDSCLADAAREALRPIREWLEDLNAPWSDIYPLIYPESELP